MEPTTRTFEVIWSSEGRYIVRPYGKFLSFVIPEFIGTAEECNAWLVAHISHKPDYKLWTD